MYNSEDFLDGDGYVYIFGAAFIYIALFTDKLLRVQLAVFLIFGFLACFILIGIIRNGNRPIEQKKLNIRKT